jgi:hypothetical protein
MGEIRAFTEEHLAEVATLYMKRMRGKSGPGSASLQDYFREIFLANPWATPDIPSLTYFDQGKVTGFLGIVPRVMEFEGRTIRVAVASQFMTYGGPAAMQMLAHLFSGPQELNFSDGASELAYQVWAAVGASAANLYSFTWLRPLRPAQTVRNFLDRENAALRLAGRVISAVAVPLEYLMAKLPIGVLRAPESPFQSRLVDVDELFDCIQKFGWRDRLKPVYERESFRWLISQAGDGQGTLQMVTLSSPEGAVVGWYVVYLEKRPGPAILMQMGVQRKAQFDRALSAMFRDMWRQGASSVKGQGMPQHLTSLSNQYCLFRHANTCTVFHSRDLGIREAIYRGQAALSKLDGESWMHFSDRDLG